MGPVSVSFVTENADFQKERFKRLEMEVREKESEKLSINNIKDKERPSGDSDQRKSNPNSEDGEISDEEPQPQSKTRRSSRESCPRNGASTSRRRSSSRSPVNAKRKRSPSVSRHSLPKRPQDRGDSRRSRIRSPVKPFQYWNNNSNFRFNNRSGRR